MKWGRNGSRTTLRYFCYFLQCNDDAVVVAALAVALFVVVIIVTVRAAAVVIASDGLSPSLRRFLPISES